MFVFVFSKMVPILIKLTLAKICVLLGYKKEYEGSWIVSERGTDARDNGYFFFKYLCQQHSHISCYYVIDKTSPDYQKVEKLGSIIKYQSFQHFVAMLRADCLISSHIMGFTPESEVFLILQKYNIFNLKGKKIFLQHGIIKDDIEGLKYPNVKVDLFICGAYEEYRYICENYRYPEGVVQCTGLARYDTLSNADLKKQILVMPTWRKWLNSLSEQEFLESEYCKRYLKLLNNEQIHEWLEKNQYEMIFYPHYEMQKFIHLFQVNNPYIHMGYLKDYDVQTLLKESALLITDYSSVYFDFAYLNKPILFFQFDQERFCMNHYARGYIDEKRFGYMCKSQAELLQCLKLFFDDSLEISDHVKKQKEFFGVNTERCCEKIYRAISAIK